MNDTLESERDRRYQKWIETGDQRWLNRSLTEDPKIEYELEKR